MFLLNFTVSAELRYILLDNIPVNDVIKLFNSFKLLTNDDLQVILFCASEYLKKQLLLGYLQRVKLSAWAAICDNLNNTTSTRRVGSQLMNGKSFYIHNCS